MSSKSKSSQSSNQTTNNADNRFMAGDGATVAAHGGELIQDSTVVDSGGGSVTMLDGGAIAGAFQLARDVFGVGAQGIQRQAEVFEGYGNRLESFAAQAITDQGDKLAEVLKWLIGGAVVIGAVMMMRKGARA